MYQDDGTVEFSSLDVASQSWMPLKMDYMNSKCKSCLSVHAHMYAVMYV